MSDKTPKESKVSESLHSPDDTHDGKDGLHETKNAKKDGAHGKDGLHESEMTDEQQQDAVDGADSVDHGVLPPDAHNGGGGAIPNDTSGGNPASKAALGNVGQSHPDAQDALAEHARNILADSKMHQAAQDPALVAQDMAEDDDEDEDEDEDKKDDKKADKKAKKSAKK